MKYEMFCMWETFFIQDQLAVHFLAQAEADLAAMQHQHAGDDGYGNLEEHNGQDESSGSDHDG